VGAAIHQQLRCRNHETNSSEPTHDDHSQGIGDLYRIYLTTQRDGVDFNLAFIPDSFNAPHQEDFDPEFMRQLFAVGYDLAAKGYPWQKTPPGFAATAGTGQ
jgi:hypothetical protein